jgi:hypothetical protein
MRKSKDKVTSLLAAIQRKVPNQPTPPEIKPEGPVAPKPTSPRKPAAKLEAVSSKAKRRIGKPNQFWFHDEHRRMIRELAAWLAGQGVRPTDSTVVRAALRMAKPGGLLLEAYRAETRLDGRIKHGETGDTK